MAKIIRVNFRTKLPPSLSKYNPKNSSPEYQSEIFSELFFRFPQFKAHVAAYIERNYCGVMVNDEDHASPESLLNLIKPHEVQMLNEWVVSKRGTGRAGLPKSTR